MAPALAASTIYSTSDSQTFSFTATDTYAVVASAQGITPASTGFTTPSTTSKSGTLVLSYGPLAGANIVSALLDLSIGNLTSGTLTTSVNTVDRPGNGHTVGTGPTFSGSASGIFVSIVGTISGTHTINLASATNYNLLPYFSADLYAGNPLTIDLTLNDIFSTTTQASGTWKNVTSTYTLTQLVSGNFSASSGVTYDSTGVPEPTTLLIAGSGLVLVSIAGRKLKRA
jgi:hypothetical protein